MHVEVCYDELKPSMALQFFKTGVNACVLPAARPKRGEVYLFSPEDDVKKGQSKITALLHWSIVRITVPLGASRFLCMRSLHIETLCMNVILCVSVISNYFSVHPIVHFYTWSDNMRTINLVCLIFYTDDWKCDQYRWRCYGRKKLKTVPVLTKTYYSAVTYDG